MRIWHDSELKISYPLLLHYLNVIIIIQIIFFK